MQELSLIRQGWWWWLMIDQVPRMVGLRMKMGGRLHLGQFPGSECHLRRLCI